ncbi:uncharacterized protein SCHCODRAFT_02326686 [Schizophyllum commune H4-8]|uniref:Expressed protein n=1 Tax=Schizophyllum commune (strain H4-8 / FGSC 9210) TaxID=578458 RepID=D8Q6Z7_SCHCM|nr:uncharacterized protein SCHCODRAFT_02326686 [Schizophyllum commune H4-8]KAI5891701.1 hypothetical protein SCHCODRAFT_02326686 [Schizophyllum commune H4-8]
MYNLLRRNSGSYIQIGQAIGANTFLLPELVQVKSKSLWDGAPQVLYCIVEAVFCSKFWRPPSCPNGVFGIFEEQAVASAPNSSIMVCMTARPPPCSGLTVSALGNDGFPPTSRRTES